MSEYEVIVALTLIFTVAASLLILATRYSLPPIPFYLIAGVFVGLFIDEGQLLDLAQWGIVFLVFAFAVELEPLSGSGIERDSTLVAVVQALIMGIVMFAVGLSLGFDRLNALYFTITATIGSSLVALSLLERRIRLRGLHERMAESIHFVEDVIAILALLLLSAFVYADGSLTALLAGVLLLGGALGIRHFLFDRFTTFAEGDVEILMLTGISLVIGFIALSELTGISIVVGAFAAGLAVTSEYPHDVETLDAIGYVEDFFAPVFFVTLGALLTVPTLETIGLSVVLVIAVLVVNPLITFAVLRWRDYDSRTAMLTGYSLDQVSEFSLIIAIEGATAGLLVPELFDAILLAAIVTMLGSALTNKYGGSMYQRMVETGLFDPGQEEIRAKSHVADDLRDHVIITSYDREGQQVVEACEEIDQSYIVIESDPTREETVREHCENYIFGDVMTESVWEVANADSAKLIVATVARQEWAEQILSFDIDVDTIVRAVDVETGSELLDQGAFFVAIPDVLTSERLCEIVEDLFEGELTKEDLRDRGSERLERAVEYGPSDVQRIR